MTVELVPAPTQTEELTTAAAVLLTQAIAAQRHTDAPLGAREVALPHRYSISHTGPGTRFVSATEAWEELAARGLVDGTMDAWTPTLKEVASHVYA